jgi:iron complex outermembrane recepter protein
MGYSLRSALLIGSALGVFLVAPSLAQDGEPSAAASDDRDLIIVTGTRVAGRTALEAAAPIDVISGDALLQGGITEVNQALSVALPSYNFPRPGLADGTDTVRPATLRGLGPDQTLVLVNSKRRHTAALVNVNGTVGRGAAAVDLNTIPALAISGVEVLRDGASAQYGSDAIAGVINVRLREASEGGRVEASYGARKTTVETLLGTPPAGATWSVADQASRDVTDGETLRLGTWVGQEFDDGGYLTISAEYLDQKNTIRTAPDHRQQYPLISGAFDPREQSIDRLNAWYGEPEVEQWTAFGNFGTPISDNVDVYGWASYQQRDSVSAGFFRRALDARNVQEIYPDGFLPKINPVVKDFSLAGGVTYVLGDWDMDTSLVYGRNKMDFTIRDTLNRSLGSASGTVFDAGGFAYDQLTFNVSGVRQIEAGFASPVNLAIGVEAREEGYEIFAGEPDSYINGGVLLNGAPTASGSQVFPGFQPDNEVDESRSSLGAYVDIEAEITERLLGSLAIRGESFSDFGESLTAKAALRYDFSDNFAVRGSVQNGFRAPSLQQQFFTATSTNFINGVPFDIRTFPATDPVAAALGAQPLDAEKSVNFALGAVIGLGPVDLTIDAYRIEVEDRIVLSENLTAANVRDYLTSQGFIGVGGGRFFINGVDTETQGVDVVATFDVDLKAYGDVDVTFGANFNQTDVTRVPETAQLSALNPAPVLFGRINVLQFEEGTPSDKQTAQAVWSLGRFGATARAIRYGEVLSPGTTAANDLVLDSAVIFDLEGRYALTDAIEVAIGADNLFDEYPTQTPPNLNGTSNTPFSNLSAFGRSGRFLYGRISLEW